MTGEAFERTFFVGWSDVDMNGHLRNTAYIDLAVDVRIAYFEANGFPAAEFHRRRFGPVLMKDEIEYRRELHLMEELRVDLKLAGVSSDVSRFKLRQDMFKSDGTLAARLFSIGGWMSLDSRKLIIPPEPIAAMWSSLMHTEDFEELPSSIKK